MIKIDISSSSSYEFTEMPESKNVKCKNATTAFFLALFYKWCTKYNHLLCEFEVQDDEFWG